MAIIAISRKQGQCHDPHGGLLGAFGDDLEQERGREKGRDHLQSGLTPG